MADGEARVAPRTGTADKRRRDWRTAFLGELTKTCNVAEAARVAGVGRRTVYQHRDLDEEFAARWDSAVLAAGPARDVATGGKPRWLAARMGAGKRRGESCVYMVVCEGVYKVGISTNLPARLAAMQTSCPFPIELVAAMTLPSHDAAAKFEDAIHNELWSWHHRGEWFLLPPSVASRVAARLAGCCDG